MLFETSLKKFFKCEETDLPEYYKRPWKVSILKEENKVNCLVPKSNRTDSEFPLYLSRLRLFDPLKTYNAKIDFSSAAYDKDKKQATGNLYYTPLKSCIQIDIVEQENTSGTTVNTTRGSLNVLAASPVNFTLNSAGFINYNIFSTKEFEPKSIDISILDNSGTMLFSTHKIN
jgi:hypothetical protein